MTADEHSESETAAGLPSRSTRLTAERLVQHSWGGSYPYALNRGVRLFRIRKQRAQLSDLDITLQHRDGTPRTFRYPACHDSTFTLAAVRTVTGTKALNGWRRSVTSRIGGVATLSDGVRQTWSLEQRRDLCRILLSAIGRAVTATLYTGGPLIEWQCVADAYNRIYRGMIQGEGTQLSDDAGTLTQPRLVRTCTTKDVEWMAYVFPETRELVEKAAQYEKKFAVDALVNDSASLPSPDE